ncbi:MAG: allantoate amidohydrolase [Alphaproteobacteria bacterium]|nr:allantoate amidohydrolase [Alphaproteobacteria bacterium]
MARCVELRGISADPTAYSRHYLTAEHRAAATLVTGWMRAAGMAARLDAAGNVVGRYEGERPAAAALLLGSHLDTVRDGGTYDGQLGVVTAIEVVQALSDSGQRLGCAIEIYAFADEEGVRFSSGYIGSGLVACGETGVALNAHDAGGTTFAEALAAFGLNPARLAEARRRPEEALAYLELHIEQGPVLEAEGLAVGTVTSITGQSRLAATVAGVAGHAGTVPMTLRKDALAAAAEAILTVERVARSNPGVVGTVGIVGAGPGAVNVIPGQARFTVDLRSGIDARRQRALADVLTGFRTIAERRGVAITWDVRVDAPATPCDPHLMTLIDRACAAETGRAFRLPSGAGHDAAEMAALCPSAMIFLRCRDGISHNPAESITPEDAAAGLRTLARAVQMVAADPPRRG